MLRCWALSVAATVSRRSASRLPAALWVPKLLRRQSTAGRNGRSAAVFVGSTPGTSTNVQRAGASASTSRQVAAVLACRHAAPRHSHASTRRRCGPIAAWNRARERVPSRTRYHSPKMARVSASSACPARQAVPPRSVKATHSRRRWAQQSCRCARGQAWVSVR